MAGLPWFKLQGDFFQHPKTLELQAELEDPCADVYVVRMWGYVSRVAPSGRLEGQRAGGVLERAIHWPGPAGRFVAAALAVGFLEQDGDTLVVHDWAAEQGAHVAKVEKDKARKPAHLRAGTRDVPARESRGNVGGTRDGSAMERRGEGEERRETTLSAVASPPAADDDLPDGTEHAEDDPQPVLLSVPSKPAEKPEDLQALWNAEAHASLPRWQGMSTARKQRAAARLRERPLAQWREVIRRLSASPFCRGEEKGSTWKASPDWILQPDVADKVLEGTYDRPGAATAGRGASAASPDPFVQFKQMQAKLRAEEAKKAAGGES